MNLIRRRLPAILALTSVFSLPGIAAADTYPLPPPGVDLVGETRIDYARHEDTFLEIARRNGLGYDEIRHANLGVDPWIPGEGLPVVLPTRYILPKAPRSGLVLNVPEMRLYYYPGSGQVMTFPVSVGRMDWRTPLGTTKVVAKQKDPAWYPPESIRQEHAARGDLLPKVVPAGPDNPLGHRVLRLGLTSYLIHGTNNPNGIGMRVTHGCLRLYPEDIEFLYDLVPVNTKVHIVNQPIKLGWLAGTLYMEVHPVLEEDDTETETLIRQAIALVEAEVAGRGMVVDQELIRTVVEQASGLAVEIGNAYQVSN